jgi:hypothetical protein
VSSYHGQMHYNKFSKLVTKKVLQNLPPSTVTNVDIAPYQQTEKGWLGEGGQFVVNIMRRMTLLNDQSEKITPSPHTQKKSYINLTNCSINMI